MRLFFKKLLRGLMLSLKWICIQLVLVFLIPLYDFLVSLVCRVYALFSELTLDEVLFFHSRRGLYNEDLALAIGLPLYTILFSVWYSFFGSKKHYWTIIIPWLIYLLFSYLGIAYDKDWNFKIITIDYYMICCWLCPLFGVICQGIEYWLRNMFSLISNAIKKKTME